MPSQQRIAWLLHAYSSRTATAAETEELFEWLRDNADPDPVNEHIRSLVNSYDPREPSPAVDWDALYQTILDSTDPDTRSSHRIFRKRRLLAAAVLILLAGAAIAYLVRPRNPIPMAIAPGEMPVKKDISPGANGAVLTLASGQQIVLDSAGNGNLAQQGNTRLLNHKGQLSYKHEGGVTGEVLYNTITTNRGRQYQLVLSDGSKVWLNASSSLKFPTAFTGDSRIVEITGEAYFEIAKNINRPFRVLVRPNAGVAGAQADSRSMEIRVLGTSFNVNAYPDETLTRTTLIDGSVKISERVLMAGQQAQLGHSGDLKVVNDADLQEVVAWKEGLFVMKRSEISSIMRQIARWYDVEIVYRGAVPTGRISGDIPRNMNLSKVLEVMALSGVHFKVEDKKVIVLP